MEQIIPNGIMPPPPPPPPPTPSMALTNSAASSRGLLLAEIRKGASLKKMTIPESYNNELSPSDKSKKKAQDLLQAELTSTLKRRKPIVINEPPKYQYPVYDDDNVNKNNDSSHSVNAMAKPLNVSAVLSVVTGMKVPDIQLDAKTTTTKTQVDDKPKISHGKPNFSIGAMKEHKGSGHSVVTPSPKALNKPTEIVEPKLQRPSFFTNNIIASDKSPAKPNIDCDSGSQVEKCKTLFRLKSQNDNYKPPKTQSKTEPSLKIESVVALGETEFEPKSEIKRNNSADESTNGITFASVANKKALFEKPLNDSMPEAFTVKNGQEDKIFQQNNKGKFNTLQSPKTVRQINNTQKAGITTVTLKKAIPNETIIRNASKDKVDHFERSVHTVNETTTTTSHNGKYETKQFEQKTFISFSKDLHTAPNNYPEQIRVKKTIVTERTHAADHPFQNIRFSIKTDGQVIPKSK